MMISLPQALLIGLLYFAANTSLLGGLAYFTTWRPLVNGLLAGLILGDPLRGVYAGALVNVLYLGYLSVGGTLGIGDAALAGILGATVSVTMAPLNPDSAIGLGVISGILLGNLGFPLLTLRMRLDNRIVHRMEAAAERGDARRIVWWNILGGQGLLLLITVPAAALLAFLTPELLRLALPIAPVWFLHGLSVTGLGLAGSLGIALAMKFVFKGYGIVFFFVGFLSPAVLGFNPSALVLAGLCIVALVYLMRNGFARRIHRPRALGTFTLWQFFSHSTYSFERLQGSGVACALAPALARLRPAVQERVDALKRNLAFFNVEPNWGSVLLGVLLRMEEERADAASIAATKQALMGPVSGFGDTVSQGAILPLALSIGLGLSLDSRGSLSPVVGVALYVALIAPLMLLISYVSFHMGYTRGREGALAVLGNPALKQWVMIAEWLGALMLGVLAALPTITGIHLGLTDGPVKLLLNAAISLATVLALYLLVQRTHWKPVWILLALMVIALLLAVVGWV